MTVRVNVAENSDWLEVEDGGILDRPVEQAWVVQEQLKNQFRHGLKVMLDQMLDLEADEQIGAIRYQRGVLGRQDVRNGYRARSLSTSQGSVELKVPRARNLNLSFRVFEAYQRRWRELDELLLEAYIGGMSCRDVGLRLARAFGCSWSGTTIAKLAKGLERSLSAFKEHPLKDEYEALVLDGMYVRLRQCGRQKRPVVAILGIKSDGSVDLLSLRVCYSENSTEVEGILRNLKERGLRGSFLKLVTIDGDKGLESAVYSAYGHVRIQSCVFHRINRLKGNATDNKTARRMMKDASGAFAKDNVRLQRKALFQFCRKWRDHQPYAVSCFEKDLEKSLEVHQLPAHLRSKASTSNLCEGLFKQIRSRTNRVGAFESPMALELFVFAIVCRKQWINIAGRLAGQPLLQSTHFN